MSALSDAREHFGLREWPGLRAPLAVRLLRNVVDSGGCWVWQGALSDGYGRIKTGGNKPLALTHRVAYELLVGEIPTDLHLDHLCRVRSCCNPAHLEPVTRRENSVRGVGWAGRNAAKTHCLHGHEFTPENTRHYGGRRYCRACTSVRNAARPSRTAA